MTLRRKMAASALACVATLACVRGAFAQGAPVEPPPTPAQAPDDRRFEAERQRLEADRARLEQQRNQIEQQMHRVREQAEQQGRRAREQAEGQARRAREQADRAREQANREYARGRGGFGGGVMPWGAPGGMAAPFGGQPGQPPGNFERELLKAHGLDTGAGEGGGEMVAFLGVGTTPLPPSVRRRVDLPDGIGLVVGNVESNSAAEQAGLKQYDILHKLNDQLLVNAEQLAVLVRTFKPGDQVTLTVVRSGKPQEMQVKLGERQAPPMPQNGGGFFGVLPRQPQPVQPPPQPGQPPQPTPGGLFRPGAPMQPFQFQPVAPPAAPDQFHVVPLPVAPAAPSITPAPPEPVPAAG